MNETIRALADQAAKFSAIMALPTGKSGDELFVEKFAELIVKECAGIFEGVYTDQQRPERIDTRIKLHFGVEP